MSPPLEHDYIGSAFDDRGGGGGRSELNLKATELRLGLPGSESPDRNVAPSLGLLSGAKRGFSDAIDGKGSWPFSGGKGSAVESGKGISAAKDSAVAAALDPSIADGLDRGVAPAAKAQVVGWPPIRSYRKNTMAANPVKNKEDADSKQGPGCLYVKVSMDGAPYLRKVDLKTYGGYKELLLALEKMFSGFIIGQCGGQGMPGRDGLSESRLIDLLNGSEYVLTYEDKDGDWMLVGDVPWEMFTGSCRRMRIMKGSDAIGLAPRDKEKCKNKN